MADQVREAFEHWFTDGGEYPLACQRSRDGGYLLAQAEASWTAWQAATASHAADVEAMRADAERYRWLRVKLGTSDMDAQDSAIYALNAANREPTTPESFDAAIDAARAALKGDKP